jgi:hypothetical protein
MGYTNLWYKDFAAVGNAAAGGANSLVGGSRLQSTPTPGHSSIWREACGASTRARWFRLPLRSTRSRHYPALPALDSRSFGFLLEDHGAGKAGRSSLRPHQLPTARWPWDGRKGNGLPVQRRKQLRHGRRKQRHGNCRASCDGDDHEGGVPPVRFRGRSHDGKRLGDDSQPRRGYAAYSSTYPVSIPPNSRITAEIPGRIVTLRWLKVEVDYDLPTGVPSDSSAPASINLSALNGLVPVGAGQFAWPDSSLTGGSGTLTMQRAYTAPNSIVRNLATVAINAYGNESVLPVGELDVQKGDHHPDARRSCPRVSQASPTKAAGS